MLRSLIAALTVSLACGTLAARADGPAGSASIGGVGRGRLADPVALRAGKTMRVAEGANFGTAELVDRVEGAVAHVNERFPGTCKLKIGDLSRKTGGFLKGHRSHQSGRDADLGFYMADGKPRSRFVKATAKTLDVPRMWALLESLLDSGDLEYAFIAYPLQRPLYEYARDVAKVPEGKLARYFQYPRKPGQREGIIRHYPNHDNHLHIRVRAQRSVARGHALVAANPSLAPKPRARARAVRVGASRPR